MAGKHVVEPPPDVALPHVAPGRPPREQAVVVRVYGAPDIDEAAADDPLEDCALLGELADCPRLSFFRVNVALSACDVQIAAEDRGTSAVLQFGGIGVHGFEEPHLCGKV